MYRKSFSHLLIAAVLFFSLLNSCKDVSLPSEPSPSPKWMIGVASKPNTNKISADSTITLTVTVSDQDSNKVKRADIKLDWHSSTEVNDNYDEIPNKEKTTNENGIATFEGIKATQVDESYSIIISSNSLKIDKTVELPEIVAGEANVDQSSFEVVHDDDDIEVGEGVNLKITMRDKFQNSTCNTPKNDVVIQYKMIKPQKGGLKKETLTECKDGVFSFELKDIFTPSTYQTEGLYGSNIGDEINVKFSERIPAKLVFKNQPPEEVTIPDQSESIELGNIKVEVRESDEEDNDLVVNFDGSVNIELIDDNDVEIEDALNLNNAEDSDEERGTVLFKDLKITDSKIEEGTYKLKVFFDYNENTIEGYSNPFDITEVDEGGSK